MECVGISRRPIQSDDAAYRSMIFAVASVEPSLTMIHLTGRTVWASTARIVCSKCCSSFRAGVTRRYFGRADADGRFMDALGTALGHSGNPPEPRSFRNDWGVVTGQHRGRTLHDSSQASFTDGL